MNRTPANSGVGARRIQRGTAEGASTLMPCFSTSSPVFSAVSSHSTVVRDAVATACECSCDATPCIPWAGFCVPGRSVTAAASSAGLAAAGPAKAMSDSRARVTSRNRCARIWDGPLTGGRMRAALSESRGIFRSGGVMVGVGLMAEGGILPGG